MARQKLTDYQRKQIIAAAANGESTRSIAKRFPVCASTVRNICKADPSFAHECAQKKEQNAAFVLAHMDSQKERVCDILDRILLYINDPRKMDDASLPQLATTLGILIDKYAGREITEGADSAAVRRAREILGGLEDAID